MKFCYYCGERQKDADAFCSACGKRVVSAAVKESEPITPLYKEILDDEEEFPTRSKKEARPNSRAEKPRPHEGLQTRMIFVTGDIRTSFLDSTRNLTFTDREGHVLYVAHGNKGDGEIDGAYEITDASEECVAKIKFSSPEGKSPASALFYWRCPPKPPAKGFLEKLSRVFDQEFDGEWFDRPNELIGDLRTLGGLIGKKKTRVVGRYKAEIERNPVKTDIYYMDCAVAAIKPHEKSFCIECPNPKHELTAVMIFLAVYMRI